MLRPGSFDYPVVVNVLGSYRVSSRWDVSTRLAYLSGRPFTPLDATRSALERRAVYDLAQVNADRQPDYFRVDVRVDRRFLVGGQPVSLFAGVQNVTNRKNVSGYSWDRRTNVQQVREQLGVFPILGLDWRFRSDPRVAERRHQETRSNAIARRCTDVRRTRQMFGLRFPCRSESGAARPRTRFAPAGDAKYHADKEFLHPRPIDSVIVQNCHESCRYAAHGSSTHVVAAIHPGRIRGWHR